MKISLHLASIQNPLNFTSKTPQHFHVQVVGMISGLLIAFTDVSEVYKQTQPLGIKVCLKWCILYGFPRCLAPTLYTCFLQFVLYSLCAGTVTYSFEILVRDIKKKRGNFKKNIRKLDGVGPIDNRPSINELQNLVKKQTKN